MFFCFFFTEQATQGQTTLLVVTGGTVKFEGNKPRFFNQNFLLTAQATPNNDQPVWKIASDCFRFQDWNSWCSPCPRVHLTQKKNPLSLCKKMPYILLFFIIRANKRVVHVFCFSWSQNVDLKAKPISTNDRVVNIRFSCKIKSSVQFCFVIKISQIFSFTKSLFLKIVSKLSAHHWINRKSTAKHPRGYTWKKRKKKLQTISLTKAKT